MTLPLLFLGYVVAFWGWRLVAHQPVPLMYAAFHLGADAYPSFKGCGG